MQPDDPQLDTALEELCESVPDPATAAALKQLAPAISELLKGQFSAGVADQKLCPPDPNDANVMASHIAFAQWFRSGANRGNRTPEECYRLWRASTSDHDPRVCWTCWHLISSAPGCSNSECPYKGDT